MYADEDKLYPNYIMLGTATGRFQARQPELHNLSTSPPKTFVIKGERPEFYNVRDLLLSGDNVFSIDFANQEDRMSAWYTGETTDIKGFIEGRDVHQELADQLGISRNQAKTLRHGLRYGMGTETLKDELGVSFKQPFFLTTTSTSIIRPLSL